MIGARLRRLEDRRLVTGAGRYVDDVVRPGMLHAVVVRSPHAHALIRGVDVRRAAAKPGVVVCLTARDLDPSLAIPLRLGPKPALAPYLQPPLARDRVRYAGEPVAVVVATERVRAVDASELVEVEYEILPARMDAALAAEMLVARVDDAAAAGAATLFAGGDVADGWTTSLGDVDAAMRTAACVVRERFSLGRQTGVPIEPRGLAAEWDAQAGRLTLWGATKVPYWNRRTLAAMLDLAEDRIDIVETDVGGSFGVRGEFYPEDFLVPYLARRLARPVKWVENRREHFMSINHSREQQWSVAAAVDDRGRLLALDATLVNDMGAYLRTHGIWVPALSAAYLPGPYRLPSYRCRVACAMTNKTPTGTVRGPGFYESTFVRERLLDIVAARLGLDPAEIRRRNLASPSDQPYTVNAAATALIGREADFGGEDFGAMFEAALDAGQYEARRAACRQRNAAGGDVRYGVGLAAVVETSGVGPFECARVTLTPDGTIVLAAGATAVGQGIGTALAQVCSDVLAVAPTDIEVHLGDTRWMPEGVGSSASRSAVMAGNAVHHAATRLRDEIVTLAARHFEASPGDVILEDGAAYVRGLPDRRCTMREIAALAGAPLGADGRHDATRSLGSLAVHLSVAAVDLATGEIRPEAHVVLCDVGRAINPTIVEGQLVGGVIQGLAHATMEALIYDDTGQLLTGTLMDYAVPTALLAPSVEVITHEHPAPANALGVKGAGEAGTSGAGAALANAVADALGDRAGLRALPLTAARVRKSVTVAGQPP